MFERGLRDKAIVTGRQRSVSSCVRLDRPYNWTSYLQFQTPLQYDLDDLSISIAEQLNHSSKALTSIDFGPRHRMKTEK